MSAADAVGWPATCGFALAGAGLMAAGAWLANLLPQVRSRRVLWALGWGLPAGLVVHLSGVQPAEAAWMAGAASLGGLVPATPVERIAPHLVCDMAELWLQAVLRLLPVGLVLWSCDLYWPKAVEATGLILPAYLVGHVAAERLRAWRLPGLASPSDLGAVLFAAGLGGLLAVTPLLPRHPIWPHVPAELAPLDQERPR